MRFEDYKKLEAFLNEHSKIDIFCMGTPTVFGDAVGPIIGTMINLTQPGDKIKVHGTISSPVTTSSYSAALNDIRPGAKVLAIDAATGERSREDTIHVIEGPIHPGSAINSGLKPVGDLSIKIYTDLDLESLEVPSTRQVLRDIEEVVTMFTVAHQH